MDKHGAKLKFGSDGYRGIIGRDFTWTTVERLALATAHAIKQICPESYHPIPVGYDTRFLAKQFAIGVCYVLEKAGYKPVLSNNFCPSPYISFAVKEFTAPLGVVITSSHNPFYYLGYKIKGKEGGSALPEIQELISTLSGEVDANYIDSEEIFANAYFPEKFNLTNSYTQHLIKLLDAEAIRKLSSVTIDFMHGASSVVNCAVLNGIGVNHQPIRTTPDPLFGGGRPEPVGDELKTLSAWVEADVEKSFGAAFDGDGDRLGLVDETGEVIPPHEVYGILLLHLLENRNMKGRVVKTVSFSKFIDRIASAFGAQVVEIPVGFKYATKELLKEGTLTAGEESGGIGFGFYLPERDALLELLLVLEAMAISGKNLRDLREEICDRFEKSYFYHEDILLKNSSEVARMNQLISELKDTPERLQIKYEKVSTIDGLKLDWDKGFLLLRLSGTEPLLRIYCDDTNNGRVEDCVARAKRILQTA